MAVEAPAVSAAPTHVLSERERADLELLSTGALAPLEGFEGRDGLTTLNVAAEKAEEAMAAGALALLDPEGARQAVVHVEGTYPADAGLVGVVGKVEPVPYDGSAIFRRLRSSPAEVRRRCGSDYVLVPVERPLTVSDLAAITARMDGRPVVLLVLYGLRSDRLRPTALVRATLAAAASIPDAHVVVAPVAPRPPRCDLQECANAAHDAVLVERVVDNYTATETVWPTAEGELSDEVRATLPIDGPGTGGVVLFFTGLSGSGKSTVAREVRDVLLEHLDREVTSLDGDVVRRYLSEGLGFSVEDRERNVRRIGWVAAEIARHGGVVVVSPIAPFEATRQHVRRLAAEAGASFVLVHVATPLAECERRDRKGLYARARAGDIPDFTGISSPYEEPIAAEVRIDTTDMSVAEATEAVLHHLHEEGHVSIPRGLSA